MYAYINGAIQSDTEVNANDFDIKSVVETTIRKEGTQPIAGHIFILKKR